MKQCLLLLILSLHALQSLAQGDFAIIRDKDGYTNVRSKPQTGNNIQDTLSNGHLVYAMEAEGNWVHIDYDKKDEPHSQYVYKDRIQLLDSFEKIPLVPTHALTFGKDSIRVSIRTQPFERSKYHFTYTDNTHKNIRRIDGQEYYGRDGEMPTMEFRYIRITLGTRTLTLPPAATKNLFEPGTHMWVHYDRINDNLYITGSFSDGAGSYEVAWKIEKGVYTGRYVATGF